MFLCYQYCFRHKSKTEPILIAMKKINSTPDKSSPNINTRKQKSRGIKSHFRAACFYKPAHNQLVHTLHGTVQAYQTLDGGNCERHDPFFPEWRNVPISFSIYMVLISRSKTRPAIISLTFQCSLESSTLADL